MFSPLATLATAVGKRLGRFRLPNDAARISAANTNGDALSSSTDAIAVLALRIALEPRITPRHEINRR
jgi:hypothetical protein